MQSLVCIRTHKRPKGLAPNREVKKVLKIKCSDHGASVQPSRQNRNSLMECVFVNSAIKIQCHVVKNTLLQTAFSAILPTGRRISRVFRRRRAGMHVIGTFKRVKLATHKLFFPHLYFRFLSGTDFHFTASLRLQLPENVGQRISPCTMRQISRHTRL